jgi:hypothetical protein
MKFQPLRPSRSRLEEKIHGRVLDLPKAGRFRLRVNAVLAAQAQLGKEPIPIAANLQDLKPECSAEHRVAPGESVQLGLVKKNGLPQRWQRSSRCPDLPANELHAHGIDLGSSGVAEHNHAGVMLRTERREAVKASRLSVVPEKSASIDQPAEADVVAGDELILSGLGETNGLTERSLRWVKLRLKEAQHVASRRSDRAGSTERVAEYPGRNDIAIRVMRLTELIVLGGL